MSRVGIFCPPRPSGPKWPKLFSLADAMRKRLAIHESGHAIAAITLGLPIVAVTIADGDPHVHRGVYKQTPDLAVECLAIMCLSGPAAEELCCGPITDHGDRIDRQMARGYLRERYNEAQLVLQFERMQLAAERLVTSSRREITSVATALLRRGTLTADEVTLDHERVQLH
jgi:ATP-dependent Zn protease